MDNSNIDKLTKNILAESKLELTNPDFNYLMMNKIRFESRKKIVFHNIGLFILIFITFDALIFSIFKILSINIAGINLKIGNFIHNEVLSIQNDFSNIGQLLITCFLVLAIVIFVLNNPFGSRQRYSSI